MNSSGPVTEDTVDGEGISLKPILGILGLLVIVAAGATAWSWHVGRERLPPGPDHPAPLPERVSGMECGPIDHAHGAHDRLRIQGHQLSTYAWIPGEPGVARIPIAVAMQVWLEGEAH